MKTKIPANQLFARISTSDADSRALIINKNILEVSYNTQAAVDAKHNLLYTLKLPVPTMAKPCTG